MTYVAEPYAQFVDDLLSGLTGGSVRQRFVFRPAEADYRLDARGAVLPKTVRVYGQASLEFRRFIAGRDLDLVEGHTIRWRAAEPGRPAADAVWPDEETPFFVNFETLAPAGATPPLSDRNRGSITRLLSESFAREFAVLSGQLEKVYQAGFLETATGRDLDALVRLVGLRRRTGARASGSVVLFRRSPAAADIFVPAGTRVSTAEPPVAVFEAVEDGILRRGTLSVEVPVVAAEDGVGSAVGAGTVAVIHRPILGIEGVTNPAPISVSGGKESDEELRGRAARALEGSGKATTGALVSALTGRPGLSEKDMRLAEDHLAHPGLVKLTVVFPEGADSEEQRTRQVAQAVAAIEEVRPVGVRIEPNFQHAQPVAVEALPVPGELRDDDGGELAPEVAAMGAAPFLPVGLQAVIVPVSAALTPAERLALRNAARDRLAESFADLGIGDPVIYNRLVADLMELEGVIDIDLKLGVEGDGTPDSGVPMARKSLVAADPNLRPTLAAVDVQVGAQLVLLTVRVSVTLSGAGALGNEAANRQAARAEIEDRLRQSLATLNETELNLATLTRLIGTSESFTVGKVQYLADYTEAGVRIHRQNPVLPLTGLERLWIAEVQLIDEVAP